MEIDEGKANTIYVHCAWTVDHHIFSFKTHTTKRRNAFHFGNLAQSIFAIKLWLNLSFFLNEMHFKCENEAWRKDEVNNWNDTKQFTNMYRYYKILPSSRPFTICSRYKRCQKVKHISPFLNLTQATIKCKLNINANRILYRSFLPT